MKVLVACEESQAVCKEFRRLGHEAYSCDLQECSGGHPEWHILGDAIKATKGGQITTMDGQTHEVGKWDLLIAHPPCTYLSNAGAGRLYKRFEGKSYCLLERLNHGFDAKEFFMAFYNADVPKIAIENPVPSGVYRLPSYTQIVQPYEHGHPYSKKTCLWLTGLPQLSPTVAEKPELTYHEWTTPSGKKKRQTLWYYNTRCLPHSERALAASKTFPGIAKAMAEQWGGECK